MINIGIRNAGSPQAGELIRLLLNHPDVVLSQASLPEKRGMLLSDLHHGLLAEREMKFCDRLNEYDLDLVFVFDEESEPADESFAAVGDKGTIPFAAAVEESGAAPCLGDDDDEENLPAAKIYVSPGEELLELSAPHALICADDINEADEEMAKCRQDWSNVLVYGIPELNRKPLVRGCRRAVVPTAAESLAVVMLIPLLQSHLEGEDIKLSLSGPADLVADFSGRSRGIAGRLERIVHVLTGKDVRVDISYSRNESQRGLRMGIELPGSCSSESLFDTYRNAYADHNLTHTFSRSLELKEVEGTDNCLISVVDDEQGQVRVEAIADARMRGGAGDAVHVMNLLAGLYEKTGLQLKVSSF